MRAAVITEPGKVEIRDVPIPRPKPREVLVKLDGCGVCASNLPPWQGRPWFNYPMAPGQLGHEGWGTVVRCGGEVESLRPGDRVAFLSDNAYANYDVTDEHKAMRLPLSVARGPFPGEPLGCAMNIFGRAGIQAGQTVAIIGIGFLGALLTRLAQSSGARVIAVSRRPFSLQVAKRMGAAETVAMDDHQRVIDRVSELTGGSFCDVTIEATGKQWPLDLAGELTKERGRLVVAGFHQDGLRQVNMQLWNWRGLDVINAHEREVGVYLDGMRQAAGAVADGLINPEPLYTHRYRLDQLGQALDETDSRPDGFLKALVMMD
jgi:threonine dehydrogenase-like Zn-dependent dehydrogenase